MSLLKEFKTFALKGNMVDLAIGIIIGASFSKVVSSLVNDVIMPPLGLILGGIDFSSFQIILKKKTAVADPVTLNYGMFINAIVDFLIVTWVIFLVIKVMNRIRLQKRIDATTKECPECLSEIPKNAKKCKFCTTTTA